MPFDYIQGGKTDLSVIMQIICTSFVGHSDQDNYHVSSRVPDVELSEFEPFIVVRIEIIVYRITM